MIERSCLICGKSFLTHQCQINKGGGKFCSIECRSDSLRGKVPWNKGKMGLKGNKHPMFGKHHSDEAKRKMSIRQKGHLAWNKGIPQTEDAKRKIREKLNGKNHPCFGKKKSENTKRKISETKKGKSLSEETRKKISEALRGKRKRPESIAKTAASHRGKKRSVEARKRMSDACKGLRVGKKNPRWLGGISFEPYCHKFNENLKEKIRERDNRTCQLCGAKENGRRLSVHHIHYDKKNCRPDLITLCNSCNNRVNINRDFWEAHFVSMLFQRGLLT